MAVGVGVCVAVAVAVAVDVAVGVRVEVEVAVAVAVGVAVWVDVLVEVGVGVLEGVGVAGLMSLTEPESVLPLMFCPEVLPKLALGAVEKSTGTSSSGLAGGGAQLMPKVTVMTVLVGRIASGRL